MIEIKNLTKSYNSFNLFVNLEIYEKEIFGLLGRSGSGKSTILKMIAGIIKPDKGDIILGRSRKISYIFQDFNLIYNKTVYDNVALPLLLKRQSSSRKVKEILDFVGLAGKEGEYPAMLSGGEKQRVAIARALVTEPGIILCDEATASLDKTVKEEILSLFIRINKEYDTTLIFVTHELETAHRICDRVAIIEKGLITDLFPVNKKALIKENRSYSEYVKEVLSK